MLQAASPLPGAGESLLRLSGPSAPIRQRLPRNWGLVLERAASQVPYGVERRTIAVHCSFELVAGDEEIADPPFASSCYCILHPSN